MSGHSFGWLGRRRHAAEPSMPWQSHLAARLPLRPLLAVAPQQRRSPEPDPVRSHAEPHTSTAAVADPAMKRGG
jgi:hypothetical protein